MRKILSVVLLALFFTSAEAQTEESKLSLEKAKEYFADGKYHESLIEFLKLDEEYNLSPHYYAYMALCLYKEKDYKKACSYYYKAMPSVDVCAPSERSLYYYTLADSHFKLGEYDEAYIYFEKALSVCHNKEKGDIYYHLGFCKFFKGDREEALKNFNLSLKHYGRYEHDTGTKARIKQLETMASGLERILNNNKHVNETEH